MSQEKQTVAPQVKTKVDPNPTPDAEAATFSTLDERREKNQHDLSVHDMNLGAIGKFTGSTNASLNIAFVLQSGLLLALFVCLTAAIFQGMQSFGPYIERLITAILTVGGFIFGVRQGGDKL